MAWVWQDDDDDDTVSFAKIEVRDHALKVSFAGTAFPTTNPTPEDGMRVLRTDEGKIYTRIGGAWVWTGSQIDNDAALAANSANRVATQQAVKSYVDSLLAAQDAMVFKGALDCSANPNYPAADRGWTYRISVAGKIGGASGVNVEAGDIAICNADSTASGNQATVGAAWNIIQMNIDGAVVGPASATSGGLARFNGGTGKLLQDGGQLVIGDVPNDLLTYAKIQNVSAQYRILGRKSTSAGDIEECTATEFLDFITNTQGAIVYRGASGWTALAPGTADHVLHSGGAGADPSWMHKGLVQRVVAINVSWADYTGTIPSDDTIPQNTEGTEYLTASITPRKSANRLFIRFTGWASSDGTRRLTTALFKDSTADALTATALVTPAASFEQPLLLEHEMAAGGTAAMTFKIRLGIGAGHMYVLGNASGRIFGGVGRCTLTIEEYE